MLSKDLDFNIDQEAREIIDQPDNMKIIVKTIDEGAKNSSNKSSKSN